jgi:hypothetical protein
VRNFACAPRHLYDRLTPDSSAGRFIPRLARLPFAPYPRGEPIRSARVP